MDSTPQPAPKENETNENTDMVTDVASTNPNNDAQIAVFTELIMKAIDEGWQEAREIVASHKQAKLFAEADFDRETMEKYDLMEKLDKYEAEVAEQRKTIEELEEKLRQAEQKIRERDEKLKEIQSATSRH